MAVKKATYQVDNGIDFDEIYFKTNAEQVIMKDGQTLETVIGGGLVASNVKMQDGTSVEKQINDLKQSASNGKSIIATAIGSPLLSGDTFAQIGSKIDAMTLTLQNNLKSKGVTVSTPDKMSTLIEGVGKIDTGLKMVKGNTLSKFIKDTKNYQSKTIINTNCNFDPLYIIALFEEGKNPIPFSNKKDQFTLTNLRQIKSDSMNSSYPTGLVYITSINSNSFTIITTYESTTSLPALEGEYPISWYVFGK